MIVQQYGVVVGHSHSGYMQVKCGPDEMDIENVRPIPGVSIGDTVRMVMVKTASGQWWKAEKIN